MTADRDAIAQVVQLYIDGSADGDAGKLKEAFHDDARMFGHVDGHRFDVPIQQFFDFAASAPMNLAGNYKAHITSIERWAMRPWRRSPRRDAGARFRSSTSSRSRVSTARGRS